MPITTLRPAVALAALGLLFAGHAHAVDYCVGNVTELQLAMNQSEGDTQDSIVRMRQGIYTLTTSVAYDTRPTETVVNPGSFSLRGGYNSDCSAVTGDTIITSNNSSGVSLASGRGSVDARNLRFLDSRLTVTDTNAACANSGLLFSAYRLNITGGYASFSAKCHDVRIGNSLFRGGILLAGVAELSLLVSLNTSDPLTEPDARLFNLTIDDGTLDLRQVSSLASAFVYNSIFNNGVSQEEIRYATRTFLLNNRYDTLDAIGGGSIAQIVSNTNVASNLNASFVPNAGSPMIDSGFSTVPGGVGSTDVYNESRVKGLRVDRGAAESPFDASGIFVVTNTASSGVGSFAAAISAANTDPAPNTIRFNIAGSCPRRISVPSTLLVSDQLFIDGYTQPGSLLNNRSVTWNGQPCIILDGVDSSIIGINTNSLNGDSLDIRGLAFERFARAIRLGSGAGNRVRGNQFAGEIGSTGAVLRGNTSAVLLLNGNNTVGGEGGDGDDNLLGGSTLEAIAITAASGNVISGNRIGVDKDGIGNLSNEDGVRIEGGSGNQVLNNTIARNLEDGVVIRNAGAEDNRVQDNIFHSRSSVGNGFRGVVILADARNNRITRNQFRGNVIAGISVLSTAADGNRLTSNTFSGNGLGIDLGPVGVSPNDPDVGACAITGCAFNGGQNFPVLTSAVQTVSANPPITVIVGSLRTLVSAQTYTVDYYASPSCNASGFGEGANRIGGRFVTVDTMTGVSCTGGILSTNCTRDASETVEGNVSLRPGDFITATATSTSGNTSEFSACIKVRASDLIFENGFQTP